MRSAVASFARLRTRLGQPPRQAARITSSVRRPGSIALVGWEANRPASETLPLDSSDSNRLMGRIRTRSTRPAPECRVMSSGGSADPVRMNCPGLPRSSQARRMGFQMSGAICHSSSRRGAGPFSRSAGSTSAARREAAAASRSTSLAAKRRAVHVLPQARGPSMSTAGEASSAAAISASATRSK